MNTKKIKMLLPPQKNREQTSIRNNSSLLHIYGNNCCVLITQTHKFHFLTALAAILLFFAALLAPAPAAAQPPARFTGTIVNPSDKLAWTEKRWRGYVKNAAKTGHETIILAWSARNGLSLYPSKRKSLFPGLGSKDIPGVLCSEASRFGVKIILGLDGTVRGQEMYNDDFVPMLIRNTAAMDELLARYNNCPALAGFLLPQEGTGMPSKNETAYFINIIKHARKKAPGRLIVMRASRPKYRKVGLAANPALLGVRLMYDLFNAPPDKVRAALAADMLFIDWNAAWKETLAAARPDALIYTDGLGTLTSFQSLTDYEIDSLRAAAAPAGVKLWVAAETFDMTRRPDDRTPAFPHSTAFADISSRIVRYSYVADAVLSYSFDYMDPDSKAYPDERKKQFAEYSSYLINGFPAVAAAAAKRPQADAWPLPKPPKGALGPAPDSLLRKAQRVEEIIRSRHDVEGQVFTYRDVLSHINHPINLWQEDACWLTGILGAAQSLRYAVTRDPDALATARRTYRALHTMANVTPVPGVVVRVFNRTMIGFDPGNTEKKRFYKDASREMYYTPDISRDQLSGYFFGYALYHDLAASPAERDTIRRDTGNIVRPIMENDMTALEFDGTPTTYGSLLDSPVLGLDFLKIAAHITGDGAFQKKYLELTADRWMLRASENSATVFNHFFEHFDDSAYYTILAYETDPALQRALFTGMDFLYTRARYNANGAILGDMAAYRPWSDAAAMAFTELMEFDPARNLFVGAWKQSAGSKLPRDRFVPMDRRRPQEYLWCWFPTSTIVQGGVTTEFAGVDYLLTYWMGKYHGFGW